MLVDSHRLTDADRAVWAVWEAQDMRYPAGRLGAAARRAREAIRAHLEREDAWVGVSWGKDSVVCAHLAQQVDPDVLLVWVTLPGHDNPDCEAVRDEYLADHGGQYQEIEADPVSLVDGWLPTGARTSGYDRARDLLGPRRITGIRAQESSSRRQSAGVHGVSTANVCRPILHWRTEEIFAYLAQHGLPVHPAYACSDGGRLDRDALRVASIGGKRGAERGRRDWERSYYGPQSRSRA